MTLVITALTSSGIVLTADSRQSYQNRAGAIRIGSDNAMKIFQLTKCCGVAISGKAFLSENDKHWKEVGYFIKKFQKENASSIERLDIKTIAEKLNQYLKGLFVEKDIAAKKKEIEEAVSKAAGTALIFSQSNNHLIPYSYQDRDGKPISETAWIETIVMIVTGIDGDGVGRAYSVTIPQGITTQSDTQVCGALWVGQTDVMLRIVKGYAPEIGNLNFVKEAVSKNETETLKQLNSIEYIINWGTITLQDAIDFCTLMTRTTESLQRFSDGTPQSPGGIPGVGGEIDIAVITPEKGFRWLRVKKLKTSDAELSREEQEEEKEE